MRREIFTFFFNKYFDGSFFSIIVFGLTVNAFVDSQSAVHLEFNDEKIVTFLIIYCIPNLVLKYLILEVPEPLYYICMPVCLSVRLSVCLSVRPSIRRSHLRSAGFELMMSVLPLPADSCCLVLMVDRMQGFNLRRHNNADVLFSYRVINSYSLVKAIKYEFSLYSYC